MNRWTPLLVLALFLPACAQEGLSKAGIPFSPTQPFSYNTATHAPPGGYSYNTGYYGYGRRGSGYYYSGYGYGNRAYNGVHADLTFRCNVDYRGAVTNVRISANNSAYRRY